MQKHHKLADLLLNLEMVMRQQGVWQMPEPSEQDLASEQPFCIDTMDFDQWLRFVMLERFKPILAQGLPLPTPSNIASMAQTFYQGQGNGSNSAVIAALEAIDSCLNQAE